MREREREKRERDREFADRISLSRGYIAGDGRPQRGGRRPRAPGARRPPKAYPAGGKLINEFGSRPPRALAVPADQENPYSEGISTGDGLPQRGVRRPRALGAPRVYPEGGKLINEFEAGLSRPKTALAGRKILIQRVYRRAMAGTRGALAPRAVLAGIRVEAGLRRATGRLQVDVTGGRSPPRPTIP